MMCCAKKGTEPVWYGAGFDKVWTSDKVSCAAQLTEFATEN
jgi:hypothetical protein